MSATIEVIISPTGDVQMKVSGVPGADCLKLTAGLEKDLGETVKREKTREFHQQPQEQRAGVRR